MQAISAGPLLNEQGELIEPPTEQAKADEEALARQVVELLRRAGVPANRDSLSRRSCALRAPVKMYNVVRLSEARKCKAP
jgi:hypothetical protein